jgi:putative hydrolase of the HAD superfamily
LQQELKLRRTGLASELSGWVISEAAGVKKPSPRIFQLAAAAVAASLEGAWVVGDSALADIADADGLGLRSAWLHRGRAWLEDGFAPTTIADSCPHAIRQLIEA